MCGRVDASKERRSLMVTGSRVEISACTKEWTTTSDCASLKREDEVANCNREVAWCSMAGRVVICRWFD